ATRDVDAPLTALGERQARALGRWLGGLRPGEQPTVLLTSPYERALRTAEVLRETGRFGPTAPPLVADERLRGKDGGIFEGLTLAGVARRYPEQAALRRRQGKFYHRPPGGESWADVILRLRSVLGTLAGEYRDERVLMGSHAVVAPCLRYLPEGLTAAQSLEIAR